MTVKEIVEEWLKANGYDGLIWGLNPDEACGCQIGDLMICESRCDGCQPAYRGPDPSGDADWLMYASKEEAAKRKA